MTGVADSLTPALERVLSEYSGLLRSAARSKGLSDAELDELLQEVRIRLWRALSSSERIAGVRTSYVYQTAMSAACDLIRRRRSSRLASLEEDPSPDAASAPSLAAPDLGFERRELAATIDRALTTLSATQQPVVRMYLAGYAQREIETLLGWTEAKTRNVLYRGLGELRRVLAGLGIRPGVAS